MDVAAADREAHLRAAKHLYGITAFTLVMRPLAWAFSFGLIGPFLGFVELGAYKALIGDRPETTSADIAIWISTTFVLAGLIVVLTLAWATRLYTRPHASARYTVTLGAAFLVDSVIYLAGLIAATIHLLGYDSPGYIAAAIVAVAAFSYPVAASAIVLRSGLAIQEAAKLA